MTRFNLHTPPPPYAHTPGRCALPRPDAEWRWRWERRCGASLQTFPQGCFTPPRPRRSQRAANCGEAAPCRQCAHPPPCPPVRAANIDNGDGDALHLPHAPLCAMGEKLAVLWDCSFKLGRNFGKMLNFSITSKKLAKIEALLLKVVIERATPRIKWILNSQYY